MPKGIINDHYAKMLVDEALVICHSRPGENLLLINVFNGCSASFGARNYFAESLKKEKYAKCAIFGLTTFARVLVSFIVYASGVKKVRYFTKEEDALKWLKEDQAKKEYE
jgi:hypothetical protein